MRYAQLHYSHDNIPVGKILCIGRNYADHAKEMKAELPSTPVFFLKPSTALVYDGASIVLPTISSDVHHEVEMTVLIGADGKNIARSHALDHIAGYGIGLDMTLRDIQSIAKAKGLPWTLAKGFDTSAPLSTFAPSSSVPDPHALDVELLVNGSRRQHASTSSLLFHVEDLIVYISQFITLERGDILFTGTPEGVAQVQPGDQLVASLRHGDGSTLASLKVRVQ
jgi:acylpyruvate hydrolase